MTISLRPSLRSARILLDLREGGGNRGFHLCAAVAQLGERQRQVELWAMPGSNKDVEMALILLRQDTGQLIPRWDPSVSAVHFSLYVTIADVMPRDAVFAAARRSAARTLLGLMFPVGRTAEVPRLMVTSGHDTGAFAKRILQEVTPVRRLLALGGRGR